MVYIDYENMVMDLLYNMFIYIISPGYSYLGLQNSKGVYNMGLAVGNKLSI